MCLLVAFVRFVVYHLSWIPQFLRNLSYLKCSAIIPPRKEQNMYVAVRRYQVKAGLTDEIIRSGQDLVSLIRQSPGFVAYYGVVTENALLLTVGVFQEQASAC